MSLLTFTLIQTNLFWEDKQANLLMLEKKINSIKELNNINSFKKFSFAVKSCFGGCFEFDYS